MLMCNMFDDAKKRCQEARCENCKNFAPVDDCLYEPLEEIDGLGIDH